jgi:hypothetical protein
MADFNKLYHTSHRCNNPELPEYDAIEVHTKTTDISSAAME